MTDFTDLIDLASERLGAGVIWANDEFFAPKEALLRPHPAEWHEGEYTDRGKWMDGWETRRRRTPGHDWCLVRLGVPGVIRGIVVDTAWFRGNFPESCEIEGAEVAGVPDPETLDRDPAVKWIPLVSKSLLQGDSKNPFTVSAPERITHLRFTIHPDGGVARLRVHGEARPDSAVLRAGRELDLAAMENGGYVEQCSDMFFGHRQNLILPGRSTHMGDGWETKRRRGPGFDWTIVRLAGRGTLTRLELDTDHYKGNAPGSCSLDSRDGVEGDWRELVPSAPLQPHSRHSWDAPAGITATHVRLNIFPDGGVARLRLFGTLTPCST